MRVVGQSRRCSASEPQPPKEIVPAFVFFSRCVGSIKKKTEIALLRLERSGLKKGTGHSQKCMFMSGSLARTLNTKASLYFKTPQAISPQSPQTLWFNSRLLYTKRDERDKPSTAPHYTQLWNQFDIDPGKLRCFPVFGQ